MAGPTLKATLGSVSYSFSVARELPSILKPQAGEILRQTGVLTDRDQIDAPLRIMNLSGLGVSRAGPFQKDADNRYFEGLNIDVYRGMWCKGPLAQAITDTVGTHIWKWFAEGIDALFWFTDVVGSVTTESIAYFVGATATLTDATAVADFNATVAGAGFNCVGMVEHYDTATPARRMYALRATVSAPAARYQLIYSTDKTTWTLINHVLAADTPAGDDNATCTGLVDIGGTLFTVARTTSGQILLRTNATNGVIWTTAAGATNLSSAYAVQKILVYPDYNGVLRVFVFLREGVWYYDGTNSTWAKFVNWPGKIEATNGLAAAVWPVDGRETGLLVINAGEELIGYTWGDNNVPKSERIDINSYSQGLPVFRQGPITALETTHNVFFAGLGGNTAARTGGLYKRTEDLTPLGWHGPIYDIATANRQIRALKLSSADDLTIRLMMAVDNGAASDTDPFFFQDVTRDPRLVAGYKHTAAVSVLILPKMSMGLDDLLGPYRKVGFTGTNVSATNYVGAVYVSADAIPLDSSAATGVGNPWGATMGTVVSSGASVNFPSTVTGAGLSARSIQLRGELIGAANGSPYLEGIQIFYKKAPADKWIRTWDINIEESAGGGSVRTTQTVITELEALTGAATDISVIPPGKTAAVLMEPYKVQGSALEWLDAPYKSGTVNSLLDPKYARIRWAEV